MTTIWIIPLAITTIGLVLIALSARRAAEEAVAFRRSTSRLGDLRPALVEVRTSTQSLAAAAADLRARRTF